VNRQRIVGLLIIAAATLGGCAESSRRWANPAVAAEVWANREDDCRRQARDRAEREFVTLDQPDPGAQFGRTTTLRSDIARFDAGRRREDLFIACMRDRGFRQVEVEANPAPGSAE